MTEDQMVNAAAGWLHRREFRVAIGVPFMSQCIDLVYEADGGGLIAVEFKRHDWRRALQQSRTHLLGANRVYICLLPREVSAALTAALNEHGIGLVFYYPDDVQPLVERVSAESPSPSLSFPRLWLRDAFEARCLEGG